MITLSCQQCDRKFTKPSKKKAEASLRMHTGRKHGNIRTVSRTKFSLLDATDAKPKRKYTRRKPKAEHDHGSHARFCPSCGFNLGLLAVAMSVATKMNNGK